MARILIESKTVVSPFPFDHLYLVFEDDNGQEFVIRGGPEFDIPFDEDGLNFDFGRIVIQDNTPIEVSDDKRIDLFGNPLSAEDRGSREIDLGGRNAEDVWNIMRQHVQNIGAAGLDYVATGVAGVSCVSCVN